MKCIIIDFTFGQQKYLSFQRISVFVRQNDYVGALKLALSFYDQTARGVLGIC
jgi:hypothetical protein